jgi:proteasome lid subunit RPN8/RPN11
MWHTHPGAEPLPSEIDLQAMHRILTGGALPPRKNLLLIVGKDSGQDTIGAYLFRRVKGDELNAFHDMKVGQLPLPESLL